MRALVVFASLALAAATTAASAAPATAPTAREAWKEGRRLADDQRYEEALAVIEEALRREPANTDLLWLRAGVHGWAGRHEKAVKLYEELIRAHPEMADAIRLDLARQRLEAEDQDGAVHDLDLYLVQHPDDREARRLRDRAISHDSPGMTISQERSDDSDNLRQESSVLEYYHPVSRRDVMLVILRRDMGNDPFGDRTVRRVGVGHERSWSRRWSSHLIGFVLDPGEGHARQGLVDAGVAWRPGRRVRLDLGADRRPQLKPEALELDIMNWTLALGADLELGPRLDLSLARRHHYYSDGNRSIGHSVSATGPIVARERIRALLNLRFSHLQSDQSLPHGYYDPLHYVEYGPGLDIEWDPPGAWSFGIEGHLGRQRENHGAEEESGGASARAQIPLGDLFNFGAEVFRSDSNLESESGFERRGWSAYLSTHF